MKHEGQMLPEPAQAAGQGVAEDGGLPQAESLAANDVAKARAERNAAEVLKAAEPVADAPVVTGKPAGSALKPEEAKEPEPAKPPAEKKPGPAKELHNEPSRQPKPSKPAEHVESKEEAEHNKPSDAEKELGAQTGKLILPTGEKPKAEPAPAKLEKPKKLAPGEVFVDAQGNVSVGE
jgi:hypothetical protein